MYLIAYAFLQYRRLKTARREKRIDGPAASGRAWPSLSPKQWPRAGTTTSIAPRFAPVSRQRAERGAYQRALGRSRGGFTSKVHCLGDARGRPIAFHLTPGEAADCKSYDTLIGLPERAPDALLADKAYDTDVIPPKSSRTATIRYSKRLYRQRNCIERMIGHLKINRAIATRYHQLADSFRHVIHRLSSLLDQICPRDLGETSIHPSKKRTNYTHFEFVEIDPLGPIGHSEISAAHNRRRRRREAEASAMSGFGAKKFII
jgi:transposase